MERNSQAMAGPCASFAGGGAGPTGVALGYFLLSLFFGVGAYTYVFQKKRREWHAAT